MKLRSELTYVCFRISDTSIIPLEREGELVQSVYKEQDFVFLSNQSLAEELCPPVLPDQPLAVISKLLKVFGFKNCSRGSLFP